jgi:hypothetical protein
MTVHLDYAGVNPNRVVGLDSATPPDGNGTYAGGYQNYVYFPAPSVAYNYISPLSQPTQMFCIDLAGSTGSGYSYDTQLVSVATAPAQTPYSGGGAGYPMGEARADWLGVLAHNYWTTGEGSYLDSGVDALGTGASKDNSVRYAALQVAIWEIVFEGQTSALPSPLVWNAGVGDFHINSEQIVIDEANRILGNTVTVVGTRDVAGVEQQTLGALVSKDYQDMLVRTARQVPEPSGLVLAGLGLAGLLMRRKARA